MRRTSIAVVASLALSIAATAASAAPLPMPVPAAISPYQAIAYQQMKVGTDYAHLRAGPTTKSARLATLKHGTKVEVTGFVDHGKWAHVKVIGKSGYISANLLRHV